MRRKQTGSSDFCLAISRPEFFRGWELIEWYFPGHVGTGGGTVVFEEGIAIAGIGEGYIQDFGVFESLLHSGTDGMVVVFSFDDGDWDIGFIEQKIIGFFRLASLDRFPSDNDTSFGEIFFLANLGH